MKLSDKKRQAVVKDYETMSAREVAEKHNCHLQTVLNLVRKSGKEVRASHTRINGEVAPNNWKSLAPDKPTVKPSVAMRGVWFGPQPEPR